METLNSTQPDSDSATPDPVPPTPDPAPSGAVVRRPRRPSDIQKGRRIPEQSLLAWRLKHGLNQREAAKLLDVSQASYARFEVGTRFVRGRSVLRRFCIITGLPLEVLVGLDPR
jgi:hypothetical protein